MRILHLASTLGPTGPAHHLAQVAAVLAATGLQQRVVNLGEIHPFAAALAAANVKVETLRFRSAFDLAALAALRRCANEFAPDVLHVWGNRAAMAANAVRLPFLKRPAAGIVVSAVASTNFLARRTVTAAKVVRDPEPILDRTAYPPVSLASLGLPANGRVILNVGGFDPAADPRMAASAFDILKYTIPDVHLVMIGDGPGRTDVERFANSLGSADMRTHFLGTRLDVPAVVKSASVVLVTHRVGGRGIALAARHAGMPVVAWNTPDLAAVLKDDPRTVFVSPGDRTGLASALFRVLTGPVSTPVPPPAVDAPAVESVAAEWHEIYRSLET